LEVSNYDVFPVQYVYCMVSSISSLNRILGTNLTIYLVLVEVVVSLLRKEKSEIYGNES